VHDAVQVVGVLAHPPGERGQVLGVGHVQLDDGRLGRQPAGDRLGEAELAAEGGQDDLRALLLRQPGDVERDRPVREDPGDEELLAVEQTHEVTSVRWCGRVGVTTGAAGARQATGVSDPCRGRRRRG
jgi:hypothetical protein